MTFAFESWYDYVKFAREVKSGRRHIFDASTSRFLACVGETSKSRVENLPAGTHLCRAQVDHTMRSETAYDHDADEEIEFAQFAMPCSEDRLRPFSDRAKEGRVNPKGHPVFYAAFDELTAISENRPWKGAYVTVGYFETTAPLQLVDCSRIASADKRRARVKYAFNDAMRRDVKIREEGVWNEIEEAFAMPIVANEERADYIPTQIIAEVFMDQGYDGMIFRSSIAPGKNVVLFDLNKVEFIESKIAIVNAIAVDFTLGSYDGLELE